MEEQQGITPPALARKPVLDKFQTWVAEEFSKLSRDRAYTESGPQPLSTGIIRTYYDAFEMHYYNFDSFYFWMTTVDDIWLEQVTARREKALKSKTSSHSSVPPGLKTK